MCEGSEHEVSWDDGRTIVEIGMLAKKIGMLTKNQCGKI